MENEQLFIENHPMPIGFKLNSNLFKSEEVVYSKEQIDLIKANEQLVVLNLNQIKAFVNDVDEKSKDLSKAEGEDLYNKATTDLMKLKMIRVAVDNKVETYFVGKKNSPIEDLSKSLQGDDEIEKGIVADSFRYDSKLNITKTGKEIKEKIKTVKVGVLNDISDLETELDNALETLTVKPTEKLNEYQYRGFQNKIGKIPYKRFNYRMTYCDHNGAKDMVVSSDSDVNSSGITYAQNQEMADACRNYNDNLEKYIDAKVEVASLDFLQNNLVDSKKYDLSQQQAISLDF